MVFSYRVENWLSSTSWWYTKMSPESSLVGITGSGSISLFNYEVGSAYFFTWRKRLRGGLWNRILYHMFVGPSRMSEWRLVLLTIRVIRVYQQWHHNLLIIQVFVLYVCHHGGVGQVSPLIPMMLHCNCGTGINPVRLLETCCINWSFPPDLDLLNSTWVCTQGNEGYPYDIYCCHTSLRNDCPSLWGRLPPRWLFIVLCHGIIVGVWLGYRVLQGSNRHYRIFLSW